MTEWAPSPGAILAAEGGFQTLPIWIFQNMFRDTTLPLVNVTATFVVLAMVIPVYLAQRLSDVATGGRT